MGQCDGCRRGDSGQGSVMCEEEVTVGGAEHTRHDAASLTHLPEDRTSLSVLFKGTWTSPSPAPSS